MIHDAERFNDKELIGRVTDWRDVTNRKIRPKVTIAEMEALTQLESEHEPRNETQTCWAGSKVSILIPALNEAKNLEKLLTKIYFRLPDISDVVVIAGRSVDDTEIVAATLGAKVLVQQASGKGDAMRQGFASTQLGDIIVMMDADGSNQPEEIPQLIKAIVDGADVAKGSRFLRGGGSSDFTSLRRLGNKLFTSIINQIWGSDYTDLCYGFLAFRKDALTKLAPLLKSKHFQLETEMFIKASKLGLKVVEVPSYELKRGFGTSNLQGVRDSLRIAKTILDELCHSPFTLKGYTYAPQLKAPHDHPASSTRNRLGILK